MKKNEQGNILFIIIVAIGLLGALMMSLSKSERYSDTIDNENMVMQIQDMYQYGQILEKAVSKVLLQNGCEVGQLNFDHPDLENYGDSSYYANTTSPADKSCHIFEPEGGGVIYQVPPPISANLGAYEFGILSRHTIMGVGTDTGVQGTDLLLQTIVPYEACMKINQDQGIEDRVPGSPPMQNHWSRTPPYAAKDVFPTPEISGGVEGFMEYYDSMFHASMDNIRGHKIGCFETDNDGLYSFYYVLLAR